MKSNSVVHFNASYGIDHEKTEIAHLGGLKFQLVLTYPAEVEFLGLQKRQFKKDVFVDLGCGQGHCLDFYRNPIEFQSTMGFNSSDRFINFAHSIMVQNTPCLNRVLFLNKKVL